MRNLILEEKKDSILKITLIDFGFAAYVNSDILTDICGTPGYIAPEIFNNVRCDTKVDVFSAGIVLYNLYIIMHIYN